LPDFKKEHPHYLHMPINRAVTVVLDFDQINKQVEELAAKGPVLLYCKDGESVSPAFAVAYLMFKAKLSVQLATLKVCQAISRVELDKMVYSQLLLYKPKN
jgi:protein-tyrosine phosphatase